MIYSNCFHAWLKTHTDKQRGIWMSWKLGRERVETRQRESEEWEWQRRERVETDEGVRCGIEYGGIKKRVLAFPLEEVLMPRWMQLLMNRWAVCGHCDPGSMSCLATHLIEAHWSRAGRCRHQPWHTPPQGLRWRDSRTAAPFTRTQQGRDGGREGAAESPQDYGFRV